MLPATRLWFRFCCITNNYYGVIILEVPSKCTQMDEVSCAHSGASRYSLDFAGQNCAYITTKARNVLALDIFLSLIL